MPTTHEIAAEINRRWPELSRDGALNREETIEQIIRTSLDSSARCIYCNAVFNLTTEEGKEAITNHVMSCDKNPMVAVYLEAKKFLDASLRTEYNDTDKPDAEVLAEISDITLDIKPDVDSDSAGTITERVKAAVEMAKQLESSKRIMNAQELRLRELGDDPSEAVAVIGEPVHPAFKERDELAGLVKHIWIHSAYKQHGYIQMTTEQKKVYCGVIGAEFDPLEPKFRDVEKCTCRRCLTERGAIKAGSTSGYDLTTMQAGTEFVGMIVCEHCGNKRCPHATDHRHACADSNEPGQAGSVYQ